jgi:hypothetical protein
MTRLGQIKSNRRGDNTRWLRQITGNRRKKCYHHRRDEKYAYLEANRSRYCQAKYPGTLNTFDEFCVESAYPASMPFTCWIHHPRSAVGDLYRHLGG